MSILIDKAESVHCAGGMLYILMESGRKYAFPVADNPRLAKGTLSQLCNIELSAFGIHWPDLDEDLSYAGMANGDFGQK